VHGVKPMIETGEIDRFYEHFERQTTSISLLGETQKWDLFARILFTCMLDTLSKVSANDPEDRLPSGKRFVTFLKRHSGWEAANRVSLFHLDRALEKQDEPAFSEFRSWVMDAISGAVNLVNPEYIVQHPAVVEPPITVDPKLEEAEKHWPKKNGTPMKLKIGSIGGRRELQISHFTHAQLLWRYRCHLIHEFRIPGAGWDVKRHGEPYYQNMAEGDISEESGWTVTARRWELVYTLGFLKELCGNSLLGLRQQLRSEGRDPYQAFKFGSYWLPMLN
jgi:hypothetical protein